MIFLIFAPAVIALIVAMAGKKRFYTGVLLTCGGVAVGSLIYFICIYAVAGSDLATFIAGNVESLLGSDSEMVRAVYALLNGIADPSSVSYDVAFASVSSLLTESLVRLVPAFFAGFSVIGGLVLYLAVRAVGKSCGREVVRIPAFSDYRLPRHFGRWSLLCYAVVLIGNLTGWKNFDIVYAVVAAFLGSIYYVQGLCFMDYIMKRKMKTPVIVIVLALITIFIYQVIMFIGIFEQVVKFRNRFDAAGRMNGNGEKK